MIGLDTSRCSACRRCYDLARQQQTTSTIKNSDRSRCFGCNPFLAAWLSVDLYQNLIPIKVVWYYSYTEVGILMMHKVTREDLERIDTMTALEAVAYANRVSHRLKCDDCVHEERQNGLALLERLTERVSFLKIPLETPSFCRFGWSQKTVPHPR